MFPPKSIMLTFGNLHKIRGLARGKALTKKAFPARSLPTAL
jgi:hypothetical protein